MPLDHSGVGVAEVARDHQQRRASHDGEAGPGVAQAMEVRRRLISRESTLQPSAAFGSISPIDPSGFRSISSTPARPAPSRANSSTPSPFSTT